MARHILPRGCRHQQEAGTTGITCCQQQEAAEIDHPDPKVFSDEFQAAQADNLGATTGPSQLKHVLQIYESTGKGLVAQRLSISDVHAANLQVPYFMDYKPPFF